MGVDSKIQWTHHTFNAWWGCARVSPGCEHCYAEAFAKRTGKAAWGVKEPRRFFGDAHWNEPLKWDRAAKKAGERHRVFCSSMADVFEDRADLIEPRARLWKLIDDTPNLDWLLLTKRPENLARMVPWMAVNPPTPWGNVWLGATAEDQRRLEERAPHLLGVPAVVRFLSCEPLLGPLLLGGALPTGEADVWHVDWVIVGGESGPGARPYDLAWPRSIIEQCRAAGVPVFHKQLGAQPESTSDDDRRFVGDMNLPRRFTLKLLDRKGGDMRDWPDDLQVRQFPTVHS